jgi:hypothetical protein
MKVIWEAKDIRAGLRAEFLNQGGEQSIALVGESVR